jgi:hypothetical protein
LLPYSLLRSPAPHLLPSYCLPVKRQYNPNKPPSPRTHVQETVFPCAASQQKLPQQHVAVINPLTYLLSQPISDLRQAEETPKAISQASSGPPHKPCADVASRAERTHACALSRLSRHATQVPALCPLLSAVQQRKGHNYPLPLANCHTARPGANTLPFPSCCLTARLETQATRSQSNFVPTWTQMVTEQVRGLSGGDGVGHGGVWLGWEKTEER